MSKCSFCGAKEEKTTPVCQSCGALRYPVATSQLSAPLSRQEKLKLSAVLAIVAITPGALIALALASATRLNTRIKK
jgi:hypothetical protein